LPIKPSTLLIPNNSICYATAFTPIAEIRFKKMKKSYLKPFSEKVLKNIAYPLLFFLV